MEKTTCLIVNDFKPFVHIELPSSINWRQKIGGQPKVQKIWIIKFYIRRFKTCEKQNYFIDKYNFMDQIMFKHLRECFKEKSFRI